jgi:hypothetical protein
MNIDAKEFSMNMEAGDMKTILKIAEKSPTRVFSILNQAIQENGHIVLGYMSQSLRTKIIDLKIESLKTVNKMQLEHNKIYRFKRGAEIATGIYLGDKFWVLPRSLTRVSEINEMVVRIPEDFLESFTGELISDSDIIDDVENLCRSTMSSLPDQVLYALDLARSKGTLDYDQQFKLESEPDRITSDLMGIEWEKTITYYYFMGGEIQWKDIDLNTFRDKKSLMKLASIRKDDYVLGLLEEV